MSLPARILALLLALLAAFSAGWGLHARKIRRDALEAQVQQSEDAREAERLANRNITRISDELTKQRMDAVRTAGDLRQRLREQSAAGASSAAIAACRSDDSATAARVLPEDVGRDLASLMEESEAVADRLRACQSTMTSMDEAPALRRREIETPQ